MNARLYDPVLGRFLSPDPFVQASDFTQSYNRYSYCWNNPLVYVDENGEIIFTTAVIVGLCMGTAIGAGLGVYEGYKIANSKGAEGWEKAWYMIGGGLIGGAAGALSAYAGAYAASTYAIGGFFGGAISGGYAGATGGFINGLGMSLLNNPRDPIGALMQGGVQAGLGCMSGALVGGLIQGAGSVFKGNNFWDGSVSTSLSSTSWDSANAFDGSPYQKGEAGVNRAIEEYTADGAKFLEKEVTLDVHGTRVRVDAAFEKNGEIILMEVKNGKYAGFTPNQFKAYPEMMFQIPVIPRGMNATRVFGIQGIGVPTNNYKFVIIRF